MLQLVVSRPAREPPRDQRGGARTIEIKLRYLARKVSRPHSSLSAIVPNLATPILAFPALLVLRLLQQHVWAVKGRYIVLDRIDWGEAPFRRKVHADNFAFFFFKFWKI